MGIRLRKIQWFPMGAETPSVFGDTGRHSWAECTLLASSEWGTGSCSAYTARVHTARTPPALRLGSADLKEGSQGGEAATLLAARSRSEWDMLGTDRVTSSFTTDPEVRQL